MKKAREQVELTLDADALTRISAVFGIYQALRVLFATAQEGLAGSGAAPCPALRRSKTDQPHD